MNIKICNKCKGFDTKKVMEEINKSFQQVEYEVGCNNMCGIGRDKVVAIVNNRPVIASNTTELIEKIKLLVNS